MARQPHREADSQAPAGGAQEGPDRPLARGELGGRAARRRRAALAIFGAAHARTSSTDVLRRARPEPVRRRRSLPTRGGLASWRSTGAMQRRCSRHRRADRASRRPSRRPGRQRAADPAAASRTTALKPAVVRGSTRAAGIKRLFGPQRALRGAARRSRRRRRRVAAFFAVWPQLHDARRARRARPRARSCAELGRRTVMTLALYVVRRVRADRRRRLHLAALPAREVAEDDQGGGASRSRARATSRPRCEARSAAASSSRARQRMMADVADRRRRRHEPDPLRRRAALRRHEAGARGRRQGRRPGRRGDPRGGRGARRAGALEPAARARALPRGRDRPDDPGRASSPPSPRCSRSSTAPPARRRQGVVTAAASADAQVGARERR